MTLKKNLVWLLFFLFAALFVVYHAEAFLGFYGFDDLLYAELSANLLHGQVDWSDHFSFRWTILGLTALSYQLFGINDIASSAPAILLSLATLLLIFLTLKRHSGWAAAVGLALFTFNHWTLFYSDKVMPDVYLAFFSTAAILVYAHSARNHPAGYLPVLFALLLFGAFLSKETVVLLVPLLGWWLVTDAIQKQHRRFWLPALLTGAALLTGYFLLIGYFTGDSAARFRTILANRYVSFCNYADQPFRELFRRISYGLFSELTRQGMLAGLILLLPALLLARRNPQLKSLRFWGSAAVILLLSANWMTITPTAYNPMCTDPRHYLFLIPLFAIAGGLAVSAFFNLRKYWLMVLLATALFSLLLIPAGKETLGEQLLPLGVVAITGIFFQNRKHFLPVCVVLLVVGLAIKPGRFISYARHINYAGQKEFVEENIIRQPFDRVITDEVQQRLLRYYSGFGEQGPELLTWQEAETLPDTDAVRTALLKNNYTEYLSGTPPQKLPFFAFRPEMVAQPVAADSALGMSVWMTHRWKKPRLLASFTNDFEAPQPFWSGGDGNIDSTLSVSGRFSSHPAEFSATLRIPSDSLQLSTFSHLLVSCRLQCLAMEKTDALVVVSVSENQGEELWEGTPVFPQIKSFAAWCPVTVRTILDTHKIKAGAAVVIYLWNPSHNAIYTDDWEITFSGW